MASLPPTDAPGHRDNQPYLTSLSRLLKIQSRLDQTPSIAAEHELKREKERIEHFHFQLEACQERGLCFCKHGEFPKTLRQCCRLVDRIIREDDEAKNPYFHWNVDDLKKCIRQRNLTLPKKRTKRTKKVLTACLQQADTERHFRFMDLPSELRLRIYEAALCTGEDKDLDTRDRHMVAKPALLHTCRQIRGEATASFYNGNRFLMYLAEPEEDEERTGHFERRTNSWLGRIGSAGIKDLRQVCFEHDWNLFDTFKIEIDLTSSDPGAWVVPLGGESPPDACPCRRRIPRSLYQWRDLYEPADREFEPHPLADITVVECIALADQAIKKFQALCGTGDTVQPTLAGLEILAAAAFEILARRPWW